MTQVSNWNTDSLSIFKSSENSISNAPTTDFTYGVTLRFHRDYSTYHTDLVTSLYYDKLFFRRKTEGGYQTWRELIHSGNIGSQSVSYASSSPAAANYGGTDNTTKIKIKINSATSWMLSFVVTIYQGYKSSKVMVSGYNYGSYYWYQPEAVLLGDSDGITSIPVYFGYDSAYNLWVGFDGGSYTGVSISDVTNGYTQISSYKDLFTISNVSSLSTLQTTITATNSVNYANSAYRSDYLSGHGVNPDNSHPGYGARVFYSWNIG